MHTTPTQGFRESQLPATPPLFAARMRPFAKKHGAVRLKNRPSRNQSFVFGSRRDFWRNPQFSPKKIPGGKNPRVFFGAVAGHGRP